MLDPLSTSLNSLLSYFQNQRIKKDERVDAALTAIVEAIAETTKYIERKNNKERDRMKELDLSRLWNTAAIKLRRIDSSLARRLQIKASYWEDTVFVPRKEILENGIALKQIRKEFEKLFSSK
jgi:hypothetical protein